MKKILFLLAHMVSVMVMAQGEYLTIQIPDIGRGESQYSNQDIHLCMADGICLHKTIAVGERGFIWEQGTSYKEEEASEVVNGTEYVHVRIYDRQLDSQYHMLQTYRKRTHTFLYRQEGNKVYRLAEDQSQEILMFDFGLKVGDVFTSEDGTRLTVTETGVFPEWTAIMDQATPHMLRLVDENGQEDVWIESVGSVHWGLVPPRLYCKEGPLKTTVITSTRVLMVQDNLEDNYKFARISYGTEDKKDEKSYVEAHFEGDTLCIHGIWDLPAFYNQTNYIELVVAEGNFLSTFYGAIQGNPYAHLEFREVDVRIPGFKPGTYLFYYDEPLVCPGTGADVVRVPLSEISKDLPIYDLQGRRLSSKPQKGVYIQDGKKIVNK